MPSQSDAIGKMEYDRLLWPFYEESAAIQPESQQPSEWEEQRNSLARMFRIDKLPKCERRWLRKAQKLAPLFGRAKGPEMSYFMHAGLEAAFVLSHVSEKRYGRLFLKPLNAQTQAWVAGAVADGDTAFWQPRLGSFAEEGVYNPLTIAQGMSLALDNDLFKEVQPNLFALAEMNAYQQSKGMWPQAVGNKVQYALAKRLSKEFDTLAYFAAEKDVASYIQEERLDPLLKKECTECDVVKAHMICMAARHAKIPLDAGYLWQVENWAEKSNNSFLMKSLRDEVNRHKALHCKQKRGSFLASLWRSLSEPQL